MFQQTLALMAKKNIIVGSYTRGKFKQVHVDTSNIKNFNDKKDANKAFLLQNNHPQHMKVEYDATTVRVRRFNESSAKNPDTQILLDRNPMKNPNFDSVAKAYEKTYSRNDPQEMLQLYNELADFYAMPALNGQIPLINDSDLCFQSVNLLEKYPELMSSIVIQTKPLEIVTPYTLKQQVIIGHGLTENGKINLTRYNQVQQDHKKLAKDNTLSIMECKKHHNIDVDMDFKNVIPSLWDIWKHIK